MHRIISAFLIVLGLGVCGAVFGQSGVIETSTPENLTPRLLSLIRLTDPGSSIQLDRAALAEVLKFVKLPKNHSALYYTPLNSGVYFVYYELEIQRNFEDILKFGFSPDIPMNATAPSTLRLSWWMDGSGERKAYPRLLDLLPAPDATSIVTGLEHIEITPDLFSGACYRFDDRRSYVLSRDDGRRFLMTLGRQKDVSEVARKGYVLGNDDNWDYVYTEDPGLTIPGLGWVKSYMYDSCGVSIYYELDAPTPSVRCGLFKWVRAGWAGLNVVRRIHIFGGLKRFLRTFKGILEHPRLPRADELALGFKRINGLSLEEMRKKSRKVCEHVVSRSRPDDSPAMRQLRLYLADDGYWQQLSREQMEALLGLEYMKSVLGKIPENKY